MSTKNPETTELLASSLRDLLTSDESDPSTTSANDFEGPEHLRNVLYFTLAGFCNSFGTTCMLSSARDLVPHSAGTISLAMCCTQILCAATAPLFLERFRHGTRVATAGVLASVGLLVVGLLTYLPAPCYLHLVVFGEALVSVASIWGECTQLGLAGQYRASALGGWGAGTGLSGVATAAVIELCCSRHAGQMSIHTALLCIFWAPMLVIPFYHFLRTPPTRDADAVMGARCYVRGGFAKAGVRNIVDAVKLHFVNYGSLLTMFIAESLLNTACAATMGLTLNADVSEVFRINSLVYYAGTLVTRPMVGLFRLRRTWLMALLVATMLAAILMHLFGLYWLPNLFSYYFFSFISGVLGGFCYSNSLGNVSDRAPVGTRESAASLAILSCSLGVLVASSASHALQHAIERHIGV